MIFVPPVPDPAPRRMIVLLSMDTAADQVQVPAGTTTVSPSVAELTAACTADCEQEDAV
jgi:hypothetical protein